MESRKRRFNFNAFMFFESLGFKKLKLIEKKVIIFWKK
jgi:hypothetical protein